MATVTTTVYHVYVKCDVALLLNLALPWSLLQEACGRPSRWPPKQKSLAIVPLSSLQFLSMSGCESPGLSLKVPPAVSVGMKAGLIWSLSTASERDRHVQKNIEAELMDNGGFEAKNIIETPKKTIQQKHTLMDGNCLHPPSRLGPAKLLLVLRRSPVDPFCTAKREPWVATRGLFSVRVDKKYNLRFSIITSALQHVCFV